MVTIFQQTFWSPHLYILKTFYVHQASTLQPVAYNCQLSIAIIDLIKD